MTALDLSRHSEMAILTGLVERPLYAGDLNRSMQHLSSQYREEDVADEAETEDLLQRRTEDLDVGSLAGGRFYVSDCTPF